MAAGDSVLAEELKRQEWTNMAGSYVQARVLGQDPIRTVSPNARMVSQDVAQDFMVPEFANREVARQQFVNDDPTVKGVTDLYDSWMELYKQRNQAPLLAWDPKAPEDQRQAARDQFHKIELPEDQAQNMLDLLWQVDGQLKEIDPSFSVATDPKLKHIVTSMEEATRPYGPGYFVTGAPELPEATTGWGRFVRAAPMTLAEGAATGAGFLGNNVTSLGLAVLDGLDGEFYKAHRRELEGETFMDKDGRLVTNSAKVGIEGPYMAFQLLKGANVAEMQQAAREMQLALQVDRMEVKAGLETYANATAMGLGGLASFVATGGVKLMQVGVKGAARLLGSQTPRIGRLNRFLIGAGGMGMGAAVHEMGMYGRVEGYGKAAIEGMKMGPVFWLAGILGKNMERFLSRTQMPKTANRFISGAFEGMGLSAGEATSLSSSLWRFAKDPNPQTAEEWTAGLVANMFAMGAFKAMTGRTPSQEAAMREVLGEEGYDLYAARERVTTARKRAVEKAETPEEMAVVAEKAGVSRETLGSYGEALRRMNEARSTEEAMEALDKVEALEERLDVEWAGRGETTVEGMERRLTEREAAARPREVPTQEEVDELKAMAEGSEKRRIAREMLESFEEPEVQALEVSQIPESQAGRPKSLDIGRPVQMEPSPEFEGREAPRPRDIIQSMSGLPGDPVQVPIRPGKGGRFSAKGILGWFKSGNNEIRLRGARDLVAAAHEFSHALDRFMEKRGAMDLKNIPEWMQQQLEKAAETYPGLAKLSKVNRAREGFAEFLARYILDDPRLKTEVPELYDHMAKLLSRPEMQDFSAQIERNRDLMRQWIGTGELARGRAEIFFEGREPEDKPSEVEKAARGTLLERLTTGAARLMTDDIVELKKAQEKWLDIAELDAEDIPITLNPPRLIDALRMTAHRQSEQMMKAGTHDLLGNRTGEGLEDILRDIGAENYRNFIQYVVARRMLNFIDRGLATPGTREGYLYQVDKLHTPEFARGADRLRDFANRVLDFAVEAGSFTREEADRMAELNPVYIPFQRILGLPGEAVPRRARPGRGVAERGAGVRGVKGGEFELRDPIEAFKDSVKEIVTKAHQAMVMKAFWLQSKLLPGIGGLVTEVPRTAEPREILIEEISRKVRELGVEMKLPKAELKALADQLETLAGGDPGAALTFFFQSAVPRGSRPVIAFRPKVTEAELDRLGVEGKLREQMLEQSGKTVWMEVDSAAYNAIMSIDAPGLFTDNMPPLVQALIRGPSQLVRFGATVFNVDFIVRNMLRDPLTAQLFTQAGKSRGWVLSGFGQMILGAAEKMKGTEGAEQFEALGMEGATLFGTEISREIRRQEFGSFGTAVRAVAEFLGQPETWLRVKEFVDIRAQKIAEGASELDATLEAMLAAKEVTTNFTRAGVLARQINQLIPYFSPTIAGIRKFWRVVGGLEGRPQQMQAIMRGITQIGGMSAAVWAIHHNDRWYQELPKWRRTNYWTFKVPGTDRIVSLPKPFEPGLLFGTGTELMLQSLHEHDPDLAAQFTEDLLMDHAVGFPWIPAPIKPTVEVAAGYDFFRRQQIVPYWLERSRVSGEQYTAATTEIAKAVGGALNWSPARVEHWINQHFGGMPRRIAQSIETFAGLNNLSQKLPSVPGFGTLFSQTAFKSAASVQKIFDLAETLSQKAGSGVLTEGEKSLRPRVNRAKAQVQKINRRVREGEITREQGNLEASNIAYPIVQEYRRIQ